MKRHLIIDDNLKQKITKHNDTYDVMTCTEDYFVGLEDQTNIAKIYDADYFTSMHLNTSLSCCVYGTESILPKC